MFENQINKITSSLLGNFDLSNKFLFFKEIDLTDNIDEFTKNFFSSEVDWRIYIDILERCSNSNFDLSNFEKSSIYFELKEYYKSCAKFEIDEFLNLINELAKLQLNFLIRPHHTLNWFIFRNEPTKMFNEINLRLNYFSDYKYLIDFLRHYFNEKGYGEFSKEIVTSAEFKKLLYRIDKEFINSIDFSDFTELCDLIFKYFGGNTTPVQALIIFLDDKNLKKTAYLFEKFTFENNIEFISKNDFLKFLAETETNVINYQNNDDFDDEISDFDITSDIQISDLVDNNEIDDTIELLNEELLKENIEAEAEFIDEVIEESDLNLDINSDFDVIDTNNSDDFSTPVEDSELDDLTKFDLSELLEKLNTKIDSNSQNNDYLNLSDFNPKIENLNYTDNNLKNEIIDFYKSL